MNESRAKAINTRRKRLTKIFFDANGREPTVEELNEVYREELRNQQRKSREAYIKNGAKGGFNGVSEKRAREIRSAGGKASAEARRKKKEQ